MVVKVSQRVDLDRVAWFLDRENLLPILRSEFAPYVAYVLRELPEDKRNEAIIRGFNAVLDHFMALAQESQQTLLAEIKKLVLNVSKKKTAEKDAEVKRVIECFEDKIKELNENLARDPLTNLLHHKAFKERLTLFLANEKRVRSCAIGFIDMTDFTNVNNEGGHLMGDQALITVARRLENVMRPNDLFARERRQHPRPNDLHARHAGDQFAFMMPNAVSSKMTQKIAERFQRSLEQNTPQEFLDKFGHPIYADIGVVWYQLDSIEDRVTSAKALAHALFEAADYCMYRAKRRAKIRIARGRTNVSRVYVRRVRWAIDKNRLIVENNHNDSIEKTFLLDY